MRRNNNFVGVSIGELTGGGLFALAIARVRVRSWWLPFIVRRAKLDEKARMARNIPGCESVE